MQNDNCISPNCHSCTDALLHSTIVQQGGDCMQINRDNYSSYSKMIQQLLGGKNGTPDPYGTDYGNYSLRFTPTDRPFNKPNWNDIMTKRNEPYMSEKEFENSIKELARKEFSTGKRDRSAY